jgi:hypothetical protein
MNELVRLVAQNTGLPEDTARMAVQTVLGFLKDRLPAPIAGQIDAIIGGTGADGGMDDVAKGLGLGDLLGKQ